MRILLALLSLSFLASAADLKITNFYRMDRSNSNNTTHEVCFKVTPAPTKLLHAVVTADKGFRSQGIYNTFIGSEGSACVVISSFRGRVEVNVPEILKSELKSL